MVDKTEFETMLQIVRADKAQARANNARQKQEAYEKALGDVKEKTTAIFETCGVVLTDDDFTPRNDGHVEIVWDSDTTLVACWNGISFMLDDDDGVYLTREGGGARWINFEEITELAELVGEEI